MLKLNSFWLLFIFLLMLVGCRGTQPSMEATIAAQSTEIARLAESEKTDLQVDTVSSESITPTVEQSDSNALSQPNEREETSSADDNMVVIDPASRQSIEDPQICHLEGWQFTPTSIQSVPSEEGFKYVIIGLSVKNGTPYWAQVRLIEPVAVTEGGFEYPFSTDWVSTGVGSVNVQANLPSTVQELSLPPGFSVQGHRGDLYRLVFKIAETQNQLRISARLGAVCIQPDGSFYAYGGYGPLTIMEVQTEQVFTEPSFPTEESDTNFPPLNEPIRVLDDGTLEFLEGVRIGAEVILRFIFTNASAGYETDGWVTGFLIGKHGMLYSGNPPLGYSVGPGQSEEVALQFSGVDVRDNDFKLLLVWKENLGDPTAKETWSVYDLSRVQYSANVSSTLEDEESVVGPEGYQAIHIVAPGDTLHRIIERYEVTVSNLVMFNCLQEEEMNSLEIGQHVYIPPEGYDGTPVDCAWKNSSGE